jgi:hypothetical protein
MANQALSLGIVGVVVEILSGMVEVCTVEVA